MVCFEHLVMGVCVWTKFLKISLAKRKEAFDYGGWVCHINKGHVTNHKCARNPNNLTIHKDDQRQLNLATNIISYINPRWNCF